jgi:predicted amidohydrolase YtcJ
VRRLVRIAILAMCARAAAASPPVADLVLLDGAVYTVDAARSWASAVAVRDGRIVAVGTAREVEPWIGAGTRVLRLAGRMVLPGFHDAHVHPVSGGVELGQCDLNGAADSAEALRRIAACAREHPGTGWIVGGGWDLPLFPDANPDKRALDALLPDRPAILTAADGHSAWVNSRALAAAHIGAATPDPARGRIERDARGEPSGTLREAAMDLITALVPEPTPEERVAGLARAVAMAHRFGITALHEASAGPEELAAYRALDQRGELALHVRAALYVDPAKGVAQVAELEKLRAADWGPHVVAGAAKIFADGVIESGTAALLEPYLGPRGGRGELDWGPERFAEIATALDRAGFQIHVHAIGDRAIRVTLDSLAAARRANGPRDARPQVAHLQLFDPADLPRFRDLGVIANFQPLWAYADSYIRDLTEPVLGSARSRWLYPIGSMIATGAVVVGGSDWSVSSMNPLAAIEVALTRRDPDSGPGPAWIPEERADLPTMIAAYTATGAWADFGERDFGSIEVGRAADLIVLDRNLFSIPADRISEAKVLLTLFGGREVFRDPALAGAEEAPR